MPIIAARCPSIAVATAVWEGEKPVKCRGLAVPEAGDYSAEAFWTLF